MNDWMWMLLGTGAGYIILSGIACVLGGCEVGLGEEYWRDERYEQLYYTFLAPCSAIFIFAGLVLGFISIMK